MQKSTGSVAGDQPANAIAITGMALRLPGARTLAEYWRNLRGGVESIELLTDEELLEAGVAPSALQDPGYVRAGAFLDGIEMWDAGFFGFNPREAAIMDPQHRQFLECAWEALELAGHRPDRFAGAIGVFAGSGLNSYLWRNVLSDATLVEDTGFFLLRHTGNDKDFLATRVSYCFDLRGPSINVQTACSTSLVAVHLATQSLLSGECDLALAGGVTIEVPHHQGYTYKEGEVVSPDGHCRPFDAAAAGTVFGSGAAVVALRRLEDALESGDPIHAIIRGSAVNNDGSRKVGYLAPSVDGQSAAVAEALAVAGVSADSIGLLEAHGTGTAVGDPIEAAALAQAFRQSTRRARFCALGSVKGNFGHLDTAAGAAGFIKAVLALEHGEIPPTLHFTDPHPAIDWENGPFFVNPETRAWPRAAVPRRAGVNSLGVGGTNAHVILEEAPARVASDASQDEQLLVLSGRSGEATERRATDLASWLEQQPQTNLADVAFTLSAGRSEFRFRRFAVVETPEQGVDALLDASAARAVVDAGDGSRRVAFLFAGGGAQYAGMGAGLYAREPVYREALERCLTIASSHIGTDLKPLVLAAEAHRAEATRRLERPSLALPALFATQYALAHLLMSWGIEPSAMIGHSMGEYTAACLAGVFSLEDALAIVTLRGRLFEEVEAGAMTSVSMPASELRPLLGVELSIAAINGPSLCVASGAVAAIEALEKTLQTRGVEHRRIHIETAAHSALLEPILARFRAALAGLQFGAPTLPFVSNLSGDWASAELVSNPDYWVRHLRETVRFSDGLKRLFEDPDVVLVEVGPGRTLTTLARIHPDRNAAQEAVTTVPHPEDQASERHVILAALGRLWQLGAHVDWDGFWRHERRHRLPLPTYPFERSPHWIAAPRQDAAHRPLRETRTHARDIDAWFHRVRWDLSVPHLEPVPARVIIFRDRGGIGTAIARRLAAAGSEVLFVDGSDAWTRDGRNFTIDADEPAHYDALFTAALPAGRTSVLHLWNLDVPAERDHARAERTTFLQPLALLRALAAVDTDRQVDLCFAVRGALGVAGEEPAYPENALIAGPARVAMRELPNVRSRFVDFASPADSVHDTRVADQLMTELCAGGDEGAVAWRGNERWVERFAPLSLPMSDASLVRKGAVVLVTGGTGGIGRTLAAHLYRSAGARLVLVSRRGLPPRETWDSLPELPVPDSVAEAVRAIAELEAAGAEIVIEAADVTDDEAMAGVVRRTIERFGGLHGVVHAAGTIDDRPLALKSDESARTVLAPKVEGTLALERALGPLHLDFFVVISSRSAFTGAAGQVDYTAANAFLDAFARHRSVHTGQVTISLAWDAWRDVGMAANIAHAATSRTWTGDPHPIFHRRRNHAGTLLLEGEIDAAEHWVVAEHRVRDGDAILPGPAYVDIARTAWLRETGDARVRVSDLMLIAPLALNGAARSVRVRLVPGVHGHQLTLLSRGAAEGEQEGTWTVHARGRLEAVSGSEPRVHDLSALRARFTKPRIFDGVLPHPHIAFGRRWSSLRSVALRPGEALAELELPPEFADDLSTWAIHPALIDLATGAAYALIPGSDPATDFYVPASYARVTMFGSLPRHIISHARLHESAGRDLAVFDLVVMDETGREVAVFEEITVVRMSDRADVEHALKTAPKEADEVDEATWSPVAGPELEAAIRPAEGAKAFMRALIPGAPSHIIVSPRDPAELVAEAARLLMPAQTKPKREPVPELPDVGPLEAALSRHEAVSEAAASAYAEAHGRVRIVAFVVYQRDRRTTVSELRRFLREAVPEALVPNSFVELERLPRTENGEPDRAALPNPFARVDQHVAPRTPTEALIAEIWQNLLGVERIGVHDNFLDIGGHSLLGVRALLQIEKRTGVRLQPVALTLQTLAQLAAECDRLSSGGTGRAGGAAEAEPSESGRPVSQRLLSAVKQVLNRGTPG